MTEDPRCYACGAPVSTNDTTQWYIRVVYRNEVDSLDNYAFTVADDSPMAIGYLNGMYHRGFFAMTEADGQHMLVIPVSRVVAVRVSPGAPDANR